jgi:hypothetical protein
VKSGVLYLYGGLYEEGEKDYTLKGTYKVINLFDVLVIKVLLS